MKQIWTDFGKMKYIYIYIYIYILYAATETQNLQLKLTDLRVSMCVCGLQPLINCQAKHFILFGFISFYDIYIYIYIIIIFHFILAIEMYKIKNQISPIPMQKLFTVKEYQYDFRNKNT